jgi:hypothetical protein
VTEPTFVAGSVAAANAARAAGNACRDRKLSSYGTTVAHAPVQNNLGEPQRRHPPSRLNALGRSQCVKMPLVLIGLIAALVFTVLKIGVGAISAQSRTPGAWQPSHSDYKQLRVEYHQTVDNSLGPPKR